MPEPSSHTTVPALQMIWRNPWIRAISQLLLIAVVLYTLISLRKSYMFALQVGIIGFVIAYVLNPLVTGLQRLRFSRTFAVIIIYVALAQLLFFGSLLVAQVVTELGQLVALIPQSIEKLAPSITNISERLSSWQHWLPEFLSNRFGFGASPEEVQEGVAVVSDTTSENAFVVQLESTLTTLVGNIGQALMSVGQSLLERTPTFFVSGVTSVISVTLQIFLSLLASGYFLYGYPKFVASFYRHIPQRYRENTKDLTRKADKAMGGYLRGQLLITLALGTLIWIGLNLIGVPLALAISFLAAIFNLVPYLGPIIGVIPAVLLGLTVSPLTAILAVVVFVVANQLEGNVLAPLILSRSTDLHPVTVLLGILAGAGMFGLLGALLAVPTIAFSKVLIEDYVLTRPAFQDTEAADISSPDVTKKA